MGFFQKTGPSAVGSRLRYASERIAQEAAQLYRLYGVDIEPRWFPVVFTLMQQDGQSVAQVAEAIGQSQAAVSQVTKEMHRRGFLDVAKSTTDGRKTLLTLTPHARERLPALQRQLTDVAQAVEDLLANMQHNLWQSLNELDFLLDQQSLFERVRAIRNARVRNEVQIVGYEPRYHDAFRELNHAWITQYFVMEAPDYEALDHPDKKILAPGGHILMALLDGDPVGTCALIKLDDATFELAKMAVDPKAQGKHVGWVLGQAAIEKARALGAKRLFLESNTVLKPAIKLYQKLGFQRIIGATSPYQRSDIQMELML